MKSRAGPVAFMASTLRMLGATFRCRSPVELGRRRQYPSRHHQPQTSRDNMGRSAPRKSASVRDARRAKAKSTEDRPAVGKRVRYLRRVKRMTLNDLAHTAGCSVSLLSRVENDVVTPSLSTLHRLCHALDTSVSALLTEPDNQDAVVYGPSSRPTHARAEGVE